AKARAMEAERIVNWSFRHFTSKTLSQSGSIIAYADVWMGKSRTVAMTLEAGASILVPTSSMDEISSKVVYQGPLQAPIASGENIGELIISIPGMPQKTLKLVAVEPVAIGGFTSRIRTVALILLRKVGWGRLDA
ncbi:D-alanyl-D-alanine carboxypeptidase, partial [Planktomarina sp.]|nr:D-alanyl-D-alanine carboxypeptidase [Planktomarina sp.]